MRRWPVVIDVLVGLAWIATAILLYRGGLDSTQAWIAVLWATVLAGLIAGHYRVVLATLALFVAAAVGVIFLPSGCGASAGCHEDWPVLFQVILVGVLFGGLSALMAFGAFLHQRWAKLLSPRQVKPRSSEP
jgi:hypothetical protein